ncbi:hypothetical protein [Mesorhizobium sp. M7A.F.Ca.CA.004.02.1.1]|uniref:hypothetical protein n=1 Tax=Mesorhizobium sp. M7A.F.Ca.CA.004.02.1.1 TaxID=2496690 RepID=UPI000FCA6AF9|nr:hypothetical protein [Mesorhizobium sp. M7A.F.Ca.CA.004.02.1.1]RVB05687.1 hypothetical protein EN912_02170 [Mesorhizobium sp. M7A.F.Ca.CA.004.02.1.1]
MAQGRVQVDELRSDIRLQPTQIQSDTYVAPARPQEDQNMSRLVDALGSFSGSLGRLASVTQDKSKSNELELMAAQKKFSGMTIDEQKSAVQSGQMPAYANDFVQKGMGSLWGASFGQSRVAELQNTLSTTHDWKGDPDQLYAEAIKADMEKYGNDPNFVAQYLRQMDQGRGQAQGVVEGRKVEDFNKDKLGAAFAGFDTVINAGVQNGRDPADIAKDVMGSYQSLGKDGVLGVDYDKLDQERLNAAARRADSQPEVAMALLDASRKSRGGADTMLSQDPALRDRVAQIQDTARKAMGKKAEDVFLAGRAAENSALMTSGNLDGIEEVRYKSPITGEEKIVTADSQRDRVIYDYMQNSGKIAETNRETGTERMSRELRVFRMGNKNDPELEKQVSGIFQMANAGISQDPEAEKKLVGKLEAYKWLRNESTQSLLSHSKDVKDRDFAETFLAGQQYLGMDNSEAINFATRATKISSEGLPGISPAQHDQVRSAVNSLGNKPGWFWGTNDTKPANSAVAEQRVTQLALGIMNANGVPMDKAIDMASEAVKATSTSYNGVLLDLQGMHVPDNFSEVMDDQLADYAKNRPLVMERNGLSQSDLAILPAGGGTSGPSGGRFIVVEKDTLSPVLDDQGNMSFVTTGQVRIRGAAKENERKNTVLRDSAVEAGASAKGFTRLPAVSGMSGWLNGKTGEIMKFDFPDGASAPVWSKTGKRISSPITQR